MNSNQRTPFTTEKTKRFYAACEKLGAEIDERLKLEKAPPELKIVYPTFATRDRYPWTDQPPIQFDLEVEYGELKASLTVDAVELARIDSEENPSVKDAGFKLYACRLVSSVLQSLALA